MMLFSLPYHLIALVASIALGTRYVSLDDASLRSKIVVGLTVVVALVIWWWYSEWLVLATMLQVAVGIYVLLYLRLNPDAT